MQRRFARLCQEQSRHTRSVGLALLLLTLTATLAPAQDSTAAAPTPTDSMPKKKGGLFGKLKKVAADKTVQSVAKMAACTVVPGGQYVAGAIDAASSSSTTGGASSAAGAASGSSCYGGLMGNGVANAATAVTPRAADGLGGVAGGMMTGAITSAVMPSVAMPSAGGTGMYKMPKDQKKQMLQAYRQAMTQIGTPKEKQDRFLGLLEQSFDGKGDPAALQQAYADAFSAYMQPVAVPATEP